jgi:hypothetical protein
LPATDYANHRAAIKMMTGLNGPLITEATPFDPFDEWSDRS